MQGLRAACLAHLEARVAEPLGAPKDWTRASDIRCTCEHCTALGRFLASPATETWTLKAAQQVRGHVEGEVRTARADLDVRTEERGRPYSLICQERHRRAPAYPPARMRRKCMRCAEPILIAAELASSATRSAPSDS
jgi:hypothetical protein